LNNFLPVKITEKVPPLDHIHYFACTKNVDSIITADNL